ncbi:MAG TPA: hypothetical protein VK524_11745 [Polyangiaceae bacterium]|nr:hypothetical protein [Polyangiaceae bacterium]
METIRSMFIPGLLFALWFAGATATFTQLAEMGGALETADATRRAHRIEVEARQKAHAAMLEARADTSHLEAARRF